MDNYDTMKDHTAMAELNTVIEELKILHERGQNNIGKRRPIISSFEIELMKDHLDLVVKYTRL